MNHGEPLVCATCGGHLPVEAAGEATTCRFCGAAALPRPRATSDDGALLDRRAEGAADALLCPRCHRAFEAVSEGAKSVSLCGKCGGVWVDVETAQYLSRVRDPDLETAVRRAVGVVVALPPRVRTSAVMCPVCGEAARRAEIEGTGHAVDVCTPHGTWFDHDELAMFVAHAREARAGDVSRGDLEAAGVPDEREGFFGRIFRALRA